jgi:hypothetical protein
MLQLIGISANTERDRDRERNVNLIYDSFVSMFSAADSWWEVGFHFIAAVNNAFILGYPALIMAYLGWATGSLCLIGGGVVSFYNNCLLGSLHETGGKRHIRYRDLAGHIYGTSAAD